MKTKSVTSLLSCVLTAALLFTMMQPSLFAHTKTSLFTSAQISTGHYGISISAPDIAENGAVVSVKVDMFGLDNPSLYVNKLQLFVCHMGFRPVQTMEFHKPVKHYHTRIKLNKTDSIFALATLNTGEFITASHTTKVTLGGCGGGGGYSAPPIPDASTPAAINNPHQRTWVKSTLPYNASRLITGDNRLLQYKSLRSDIKINGHRARVMLDMEFYNPYNWQREGRFQLRLPENSVPYYVAFGDVVYMDKQQSLQHLPGETSGFTRQELAFDRYQHPAKLKEAVMVPRNQARDAYQTIVGNRRDPALVEWQGGGVYSVNVFPIQPYSMHRVVIAYDMDLQEINNALEYVFNAPDLDIPTDVYVHIDEQTAGLISNLNAKPVFVSRDKIRLYQFKPTKSEEIRFSFIKTNDRMLVGNDRETGQYFSYKFKPDIPAGFAESRASHAVFALDTSIAMSHHEFSNQVELLHALLESNNDDIKYFAVLFFDVGTHWWKNNFVKNTQKNRNALKQFIAGIHLAGATDLQRALSELSQPHWLPQDNFETDKIDWDVFLLTDGRATWGDTRPKSLVDSLQQTNRIRHLNAYVNNGQHVDWELLDLLTSKANGAIFDYPPLYSQKAYAADPVVYAHRMTKWRVVSASARGANDLFLANAGLYTYANQELILVGRGKPQRTVELVLESDQQRRELSIAIPTTEIQSSMTPRIYAEAAVRKLEDYADDNKQQALMYATHFRVPRQSVSLLMLESEKDYQRFAIDKHVNYADEIRQTRVAQILVQLDDNEPAREDIKLAELPRSQLEDVSQLMQGYTICTIPDRFLASLKLDSLANRPTIKHNALHLGRTVYHTSIPIYNSGYLTEYFASNIYKQADQLIQSNQRTTGLRIISSVTEFNNATFQTRLELAKKLIEHGFANEAYYLISMTPHIYNTPENLELLITTVELENEPTYANALRALAKLGLNFNKQALEP